MVVGRRSLELVLAEMYGVFDDRVRALHAPSDATFVHDLDEVAFEEMVDLSVERRLGDVAELCLDSERGHGLTDQSLDDAEPNRVEQKISLMGHELHNSIIFGNITVIENDTLISERKVQPMQKISPLTFDSAGHLLSGTLTLPDLPGQHPGVVLLSGSGQIDRNSNAKRLKLDIMGQVAAHLALLGIASFRYDKRGVGESEGEYASTGFHDNVVDARAALETLGVQPGVDPKSVFVIGHSEGALIAGELAAGDAELTGVVLLAGAAQSGEDILLWQMTQVAASIPTPVKWLLKLLRQDLARTQVKRLTRIKESTEDVMRIQLVKINAKWFREFMAYDPRSALRRIERPVVAITGSKDIQVDPGDLDRMSEVVQGEFTSHLVEDVTHLLRTEDGPASLRTYKKQAKRPSNPVCLRSSANGC